MATGELLAILGEKEKGGDTDLLYLHYFPHPYAFYHERVGKVVPVWVKIMEGISDKMPCGKS